MPIEYSVSSDGHFIHAIAQGKVSKQEFVDYEINHAVDTRIKRPVSELFEIHRGALRDITRDDITAILERRKELEMPHTQHRCGLVVSLSDTHSWDLAKFYEGMTILHFPEVVIVFGDLVMARNWLGIENT